MSHSGEENQVSEELFNTELTDEASAMDDEQMSDEEIEKTEEIEQQNTEAITEEDFTEMTEEALTEITVEGSGKQATKKTVTQDRITQLPIAKIKHIIKLDPEVKLVNAEAVFLITKATEYFIKSLSKESFGFAAQNKKKTITKSHVDSALTMLPVEL